MSSAMNEEHAFARIERSLAREDPELAQRIEAINSQFTDLGDEGAAQADERRTGRCDGRAGDRTADEDLVDQAEDGVDQRSWSAVVAVVLAAVVTLGLLLTAILSSPSGTQEPSQPNGLAPPAALDVVEEPPSPRQESR
jgi:anti-sigma-K factor RskA